MSQFAGQMFAGLKAALAPTKLRYLFFCITVFGIIYFLYISNVARVLRTKSFIPGGRRSPHIRDDSERFTINTAGCSIPYLDPYDETVKQFAKFPQLDEVCPNATISYLGDNETHIWVKEENKQLYNLSDSGDTICCYQPFYRPLSVKDVTSTHNDDRVQYDNCTFFTDVIEARDEFVRVTCSSNTTEPFYTQYYLFALKKDPPASSEVKTSDPVFNVLVMGIDAVSRLNFHRTMPKTLKYLKENGAVELFGYNKVGDNTFPNLIPMLLGISEKELKTTCTPRKKSTFDNCPFVWEQYRETGYYTAFGEDTSWLGTFNYVKPGFLSGPTDYYIHTFMNEAEDNVGTVKDFNSYLCMNDKYFYRVLLDYINNLFATLNPNKFFGFFWEVSMSHDYLNYPMLIDDQYETFFKNLEEKKYLAETILLLVSDHGIRWGDIRQTKQGRLEERLPFVYVLTPSLFRTQYSEAYNHLKLNSRRLTTPYDVHATLADLSDISRIGDKNITLRKTQFYSHNRGISLFLPIPSNRTCAMADIEDHWCTCHRSVPVATDSAEAIEAAGMLTRKINSFLQNYKQCAKLKNSRVIEVNKVTGGSPDGDLKGWHEYMAIIETSPGNGVFEATLRRYSTKWTLQGSISRLNLYGEQSHCVNDAKLKLYCFCQ
ncbi:uncharacterized protein LOC121734794 [Aricia agestis]|uniref:uncharacterized protein LOC121734794 n=1 Tax=Aricia agestis TaxID=91739 RepID=UPI001C2042B8|nr:uncharacterized protein LOC121734794 [Aricia agestis]